MPDASQDPPRLGDRIILGGITSVGKSTLGARLAEHLNVPHVEMDALFWQPGWTEPPAEEFRARVADAVRAERWVLSGNYWTLSGDLTWPAADQVIWLDLGLRTVIPRVLRRSWVRYRNQELLWGTNRERFWGQLKVWDEQDSLIAFALRHAHQKRRDFEARMTAPEWSHIDFVRLRSPRAIDAWVAAALDASARERDVEDPSWRSA